MPNPILSYAFFSGKTAENVMGVYGFDSKNAYDKMGVGIFMEKNLP